LKLAGAHGTHYSYRLSVVRLCRQHEIQALRALLGCTICIGTAMERHGYQAHAVKDSAERITSPTSSPDWSIAARRSRCPNCGVSWPLDGNILETPISLQPARGPAFIDNPSSPSVIALTERSQIRKCSDPLLGLALSAAETLPEARNFCNTTATHGS